MIQSNFYRFLGLSPQYYAVDSTVYFAFEKVGEVDFLLRFCEGKSVLTPKIEEEIFGLDDAYYFGGGAYSTFTNFDIFDRWIREPSKLIDRNDYLLFTNDLLDYNLFSATNSYRDYFYIANTNYLSTYLTTSFVSGITYCQVNTNIIKTEPDKEILGWALANVHDTTLLTNDRVLVRLAQKAGAIVMGAVGILISAVKKGLILLKEAERIYNRWSIVDPGSCIWKKIKGVKTLINFQELYLLNNNLVCSKLW